MGEMGERGPEKRVAGEGRRESEEDKGEGARAEVVAALLSAT